MKESSLIGRLIDTEEYRALQRLQPDFNLFSLLDDALNEPAWSRILAGLLDSDRPHGLGTSPLQKWLELVACEVPPSGDMSVVSMLAIVAKASRVRSSVEYTTPAGRRIDILLRVLDSSSRTIAVIGIENKLGSPEQPAQIADYQAALSEVFPHAQRLLVYLTPDRRTPRTANVRADTPCQPTSYQTLVGMCQSLAVDAQPQVKMLLDSVRCEVEATVLGEDRMKTTAAALISKLWQDPDHRRALRLISECIPTPRKTWESRLIPSIKAGLLSRALQMEVDSVTYDSDSTSPRQIKVWWGGELARRTALFQFYLGYMLHSKDRAPDIGSAFTLRLVAWCESPDARRTVLGLGLDSVLPSSGEKDGGGGKLEAIWTGESYVLQDLGSQDVDGLRNILLDGVSATYSTVEQVVMKLCTESQT